MEQLMKLISEYKTIIIVVVMMLIISRIVYSIFRSLRTKARIATNNVLNKVIDSATRQALGHVDCRDIGQLIDALKDASQEPEAKSVAGATNLYLPQITKDFADFHNIEALAAIKIFINEYLDIKYGQKDEFVNSNIEPGLELTINKESIGEKINNIKIHKTAISGYTKTNEYATITYQAAVGYNIGVQRIEEKYKIEYTMKLSENNIADKALRCDVCGASLDSAGIEVCPYCDSRIIRDTRMSWKFTSVERI